MSNLSRAWCISALTLATLSLHGCRGESPVAYDSDEPASVVTASVLADSVVTESVVTEAPAREVGVAGMSAQQLLNDPMLHLVLESLQDEGGGGAISAAIESTRAMLASGDLPQARVQLDLARAVLGQQSNAERADATDLVHLEVVGMFLAGVARMLG